MDNLISSRLLRQYEMLTGWINGSLNVLSDEELKIEIIPGKNHGIWILGHLIVSDDDLSLFLGKGELLFPEYQEIFGQGSSIRPAGEYPEASLLRKQWKDVYEKCIKIYRELKDSEVDEPHNLIKDIEEDYFKTKFGVIVSWQIHQAYHAGQLGLLVSKAGKSKY